MLSLVGNYRKGYHSSYNLKYHIVWVTKYRKQVLGALVGKRLREILRETCTRLDVEIISGHISKDHVHMLVSVPPNVALSKLLKKLKGRSSRKMQREFKVLKKQFWGRHLWSRGYFVCTVGHMTNEVIEEYVGNQETDSDEHDGFWVEG